MRVETKKTVSVVLCTYNGEKYLRKQLDSVLSQTYPLFEILIQDDCSSDGTWEIIEEYKKKFPDKVYSYRNDTNMFWIQNFYSAILKAKGDLVALCDQDDVWHPEKIEKQVRAIGDNLLCVCSHYIWTEERSVPIFSRNTTPSKEFIFPHYSLHTMLISREMIECYIPFGRRINMSCDTFIAQLSLCLNRNVVIPDLMVYWRRHGSTTTSGLDVKDISGFGKILYCMKSFLVKKKSTAIEVGLARYIELYKWLKENKRGFVNYDKMIGLMNHLKNQTIWDYLCAGFVFITIRNEIWGYDGFSLRQYYSVLSFPFRWWYMLKDGF